jgi:hypothetical protein
MNNTECFSQELSTIKTEELEIDLEIFEDESIFTEARVDWMGI